MIVRLINLIPAIVLTVAGLIFFPQIMQSLNRFLTILIAVWWIAAVLWLIYRQLREHRRERQALQSQPLNNEMEEG